MKAEEIAGLQKENGGSPGCQIRKTDKLPKTTSNPKSRKGIKTWTEAETSSVMFLYYSLTQTLEEEQSLCCFLFIYSIFSN